MHFSVLTLMLTSPKVSVLIPTYNYAHVLDETIQCVLDQTFADFELIIVDDRSTDTTDAVVSKYLVDRRVQYHKNDTNLGAMGNWNQCLQYAKGEYIKYLCADDKLHPQMLEKYVPIMDVNPSVSIITCNKQEFGDSTRLLKIPERGLQQGKKMILATIRRYNWLGEPTLVMFRRRDVEKVGHFRNYIWIIDWEMWIRLLAIGDCYIVPETLAYIRRHPNQVTKKVFKNLISRTEEYYLFKSLQQGKYNIDLSDKKSVVRYFVKRKAARCAKDMYMAIPKVRTTKQLRTVIKLFSIAYKERVLFRPLVAKIRQTRP